MAKFIIEMAGEPGTTISYTCGDTAKQLTDVTGWVAQKTTTVNSVPRKRNVIGALITVETHDIRFSYGTNPVQSGSVIGHILYATQSIKLNNHKQIIDFRFINKTGGSNAVLRITPEFSNA